MQDSRIHSSDQITELFRLRLRCGTATEQHVLDGWELELAASGERDGEVADDGEVDGEPHLELVVDIPVPADVLDDRDEEVVGHLGWDLQLGAVAGGDPAGVGHGAGRNDPATTIDEHAFDYFLELSTL